MSAILTNETIQSIFTELAIPADHTSVSLTHFANTNHKYLRDLKLNVLGMLNSKNLSKKEAYLIGLSVAVNQGCDVLMNGMEQLSLKAGATAEEIAETHACVSLMNTNNVLYRFRHFMEGNEYYSKTPAGLRMSIMMTPAMGKQLFEMISLVVSALNGCEQCVTSHEASVKGQGAEEAKIYDAIRIGASIKSLCVVL